MKTAPALAYPTGAPHVEGLILTLLALAWLLAQLLWLHAHEWQLALVPGPWWVSWWLGLLLLAWSFWRLRARVVGELVWTPHGEPVPAMSGAGSWRLFTPAWRRGLPLDGVTCVIDLNGLMLLRLRSATGLRTWLWCQCRSNPGHWMALRRAVYAYQPAGVSDKRSELRV